MHKNLSRSEFMKIMAGSIAATLLPREASCTKKIKRPNVLFIVSDDLNDCIGCLGGHPDSKTPNIDKLCARGVLFEKAYCSAPICNPSRASLMTGLMPSTTGVYGNRQVFRMSDRGRNAVTLTQYFMQHGYYATGAGKIYHGKFPDPASWSDFYPALDVQGGGDPQPENVPLNGMKDGGNIDWGPLDIDDSDMGDFKTVSYCISQLNKTHEKPFLLACGLRKPHLPWYVPRKYFEKYPVDKVTLPVIKEDDLDDVPAIGRKFANPKIFKKIRNAGKWRDGVAAYLATVSWVDSQIGRLMDALDKSQYADNTIIVFWGDHGWHLAEKLHWKKSTLWEEATRAPLMFAAPGVTKTGSRCSRPVSFLDIYPTLIDLCGLAPKSDLEGLSLVPLLKNPQKAWERPAITTHKRGNHSIRTERWRYIRYSDGTEEFYDHSADEYEWKNLANDPAFNKIKKKLAEWLPKYDAPDSEVVKWPEEQERVMKILNSIRK